MKHCKIFPVLPALPLFLLLSACSPMQKAINPYEEDFKCRAPEDAGKCVDTPTAYKDARYPRLDDELLEPLGSRSRKEALEHRYKTVAGLLREEKKPLLVPAKVLRVLLLPYRGQDGELFMSRYVYVKIEDSQWILTDLSEGRENR
jgi:conjugal transfer pilus assembly protein TraV